MITRLELSGDRWIDVKDELLVSDDEDMQVYATKGISTDGKTYEWSVAKYNTAHAAVRILNWGGFKDEDGHPIPWPTGKPFKDKVSVIRGLKRKALDGITEAIRKHVEALEKAEADAKKDEAGGASNFDSSSQ